MTVSQLLLNCSAFEDKTSFFFTKKVMSGIKWELPIILSQARVFPKRLTPSSQRAYSNIYFFSQAGIRYLNII